MQYDTDAQNLAHRLATPVTNALLGLEEIVEKPHLPTKEVHWVLEEIKNISAQLQSRDHEALEQRSFYPQRVVRNLLANYRKPYRVKCAGAKQATQMQVFGQAQAFSQIVTHLLNNAAESYHSNRSGREISVELVPACSGINLIVGDNGGGISWWQRLLLGWRGVSFKKHRGGRGLPEVRRLLKEEFAGELKVVTKKGKGTMMIAHLPLR